MRTSPTKRFAHRADLCFAICLAVSSLPVAGQQESGRAGTSHTAWTWKDRAGKVRSEAELLDILQKHQEWLNSVGSGLPPRVQITIRQAELRRIEMIFDLETANPSRAVLRGADLREADLLGANLAHADLREANLNRSKGPCPSFR